MESLEKAIHISSMSVYTKKVADPTTNRETKKGSLFLYQGHKATLMGQVDKGEIEKLDEAMCSATSSWEYCPIIQI